MQDEDQDELTPRERGVVLGYTWAELARARGLVVTDAKGRKIDPLLAAAHKPPVIATEVRDQLMDEGMRERLDASDDPDAESAFWAGFGDGVRAYLVEVEIEARSD
jgi:hypothetical protein